MSRKKLINTVVILIVAVVGYFLNEGNINLGQNQGGSKSSGQQQSQNQSGFDHYVLALSWSPTFCATDGKGNKEQCGPGRNYAFIVHGLWPQFDKGGWPADCAGNNAPRVPNSVIDDVRDIMPSKGLIIHEWRKHVSCSGLNPAGYYDIVRGAYDKVKIPQQFTSITKPLKVSSSKVVQAFVDANPGLPAKAVRVTCDNRLREVRICMDKSLGFRDCGKKSGKVCKANRSIVMLPSR